MNFNILEYRKFVANGNKVPIKRIVRNHELDFCIDGKRTMYLDDTEYIIQGGCICFRRPGQTVYSIGPYNDYMVTIDFSRTVPVENYWRNTAITTEPPYNNILTDNIPTLIHTKHTTELKSLFTALCNQPEFNSILSHSLFKEILLLINADIYHNIFEENHGVPTAVDHLFQYISNNFKNRITLDILSEEVHLDKSYIVRMFKKRFEITPIEFLITCRLNHAKALLSNTYTTVQEIALSCGYNSTSLFIEQFKKHFSVTPTEYRDKIIKSDAKN